ncbi:MAG: phosphate acetyltransferase [Calditrichaceae bacterium]
MTEFVVKIRENAKKRNSNRIVLPEGAEPRVVKAAVFLKENKLVEPILLGKDEMIQAVALENGVSLNGITIIDPKISPQKKAYAEQYYQLRKHKGMTLDEAETILESELYYGAMMVRNGEAKGAVAGSVNTTGDVLRAAIQIIGLAEGIKAVSSSFVMILPDGRELVFGDCAVIPNPDVDQLTSIAVSSAKTYERLVGKEPKVAMLSFSTKGSAVHEDVDKVLAATEKIREIKPDLKIDGELQFDAAIIDSIGKRKAPGSPVAGNANVFIFPDLDAGNIGYKIAERLAGAEAIGPVIQGLAKPYNDLSRGCSVDDIVNVACICSTMS